MFKKDHLYKKREEMIKNVTYTHTGLYITGFSGRMHRCTHTGSHYLWLGLGAGTKWLGHIVDRKKLFITTHLYCQLFVIQWCVLHTQNIWVKYTSGDFPGGAVGKTPPADPGNKFDPCSGKIPYASERLSPCATTTEAAAPAACAPQEEPLQGEARAPQEDQLYSQ